MFFIENGGKGDVSHTVALVKPFGGFGAQLGAEHTGYPFARLEQYRCKSCQWQGWKGNKHRTLELV